MTLAELRAALAKLDHLPDETKVILAKDAEGNGFSPLDGPKRACTGPRPPGAASTTSAKNSASRRTSPTTGRPHPTTRYRQSSCGP